MLATAKLTLDQRVKKKNGLFPVKLRVRCYGKKVLFHTNIDLAPEDFRVLSTNGKVPKNLLVFRDVMDRIELKARNIISDLREFTFEEFERRFYGYKSNDSIDKAYKEKIEDLRRNGQERSAVTYETSMHSLLRYRSGLKLLDINPKLLEDYERWMLSKGNSKTTVGIYLRALRCVMNIAIQDGHIDASRYPFGPRKYTIPASRGTKRALPIEQIVLIKNLVIKEGTTKAFSRDMWMFSFYCGGMNAKDIVLLKYENLDGDFIEFSRAKTSKTTKGNAFSVRNIIPAQAKEIIRKYKQGKGRPEEYVFGIMEVGADQKREAAIIAQFVQNTNKYMAEISTELKLPYKVTTYWARHGHANFLKQNGVSLEMIAEVLGHTNTNTTRAYLSSFRDDIKQQLGSLLDKF
jgi:integrase/recombinase XerD